MWDGISDSVKANVDKIMNLTMKDLDEIKKRPRMALKPAARLEVERVLEMYSQKPIVFYDKSEFIPASHFGSASYLDIVVFYSLSKLYPCARVNGKLYLIKLSNRG